MAIRGEPLSVSDTILQDIAALKQSQADMRRSIDENNRNSQQSFTAMNVRLDTMAEMLQTVARIAERQESHGSGLERAFGEIRHVRSHVDEHVDDIERWQENHERDNASTERKLATWHGIAIGISLASAAIVGVLGLLGSEVINNVRDEVGDVREDVREVRDANLRDVREVRDVNQRDDQRLDRLERIEAQYHGVK